MVRIFQVYISNRSNISKTISWRLFDLLWLFEECQKPKSFNFVVSFWAIESCALQILQWKIEYLFKNYWHTESKCLILLENDLAWLTSVLWLFSRKLWNTEKNSYVLTPFFIFSLTINWTWLKRLQYFHQKTSIDSYLLNLYLKVCVTHCVEVLGFFCHSDFTWNQLWRI